MMLDNLKTGLVDVATLHKEGWIGYYRPDMIPDYIKNKVAMIFKAESTSKASKKVYRATLEIMYQVQNTKGWSSSRNLKTAIQRSGKKRLYQLPDGAYVWRKTALN